MTDRLQQGLEWLAVEVSSDRAEFAQGNQPDGAALLEGLVSHGYVREQRGRYDVSPAGFRRMEAVHEPA